MKDKSGHGNVKFTVETKAVKEKIVVIRKQEVIADADVAALYGVQTKEVNQAVRNNPNKFPMDYMFELSKSELRDLRSNVLTTNVSLMSRNPTKVFTEKGLYMLATILKSERAAEVTFALIETFAKVRSVKRELLELHKETDKEKQKTSMCRTARIVSGQILGSRKILLRTPQIKQNNEEGNAGLRHPSGGDTLTG